MRERRVCPIGSFSKMHAIRAPQVGRVPEAAEALDARWAGGAREAARRPIGVAGPRVGQQARG